MLSCGDIESNPDPGLYMVCPSYKGQAHVQKSVCTFYLPDMVVTINFLLVLLLQLINLVLLQHSKLIVVKNLLNVLCSDSDVSTEHTVCDSQDIAGTISTKDENSCDAGGTTCCRYN